MPRYEIVTHVAIELDGATPEEAASVFKREFLRDQGISLHSLAVWPTSPSSRPSPLPPPLLQQLLDFFAAVARHAAVEEEVFRARVEDIFMEAVAVASAAASSGLDPVTNGRTVGEGWIDATHANGQGERTGDSR
ncbi:MAG: hypothetical protein QOJ59_1343 [Thermomicrobiales bacterium]|nr:hypothetical protein [Thermomicrobiales bacterium]